MKRFGVGLAFWALGACADPPNTLSGSIADKFSLEFGDVLISKLGCVLQIDYLYNGLLGPSVPCRITFDTEDLNVVSGFSVTDQLFLDEVDVTRIAAMGGDFPEVKSGVLRLNQFSFEPGEKVAGDFEVVFEDDTDLAGTFDDVLLEPDPSLKCD